MLIINNNNADEPNAETISYYVGTRSRNVLGMQAFSFGKIPVEITKGFHIQRKRPKTSGMKLLKVTHNIIGAR